MNPTCLRIIRTSFDDSIENMPHNDAYFANLISMNSSGGSEQLEAMKRFPGEEENRIGQNLKRPPF